VSIFIIGYGSSLDKVVIDTDETDSVTAWLIGNGLNVASHHDEVSLDVLDFEVSLRCGLIVGANDSNFLASSESYTENKTKSIEAALVFKCLN